MSQLIIHGRQGSYKTSSLCIESIPFVLAGRPIITNVRAFNPHKIKEIYGGNEKDSFPEYVRLFNADDSVDPFIIFALRHFFLWAPFGAVFLIDEAGLIFPDVSTFRMEKFDFHSFKKQKTEFLEQFKKSGLENDLSIGFDSELSNEQILAQRPSDLSKALQMQRHFNWDFIFTLPNISLLNSRVRALSEKAFFQNNLSTRFSKLSRKVLNKEHSFRRFVHDAHLSEARAYHEENIKIDQRIFDCYESTFTGLFAQSVSEAKNSDNKKLYVVAILFCIVLLLFIRSNPLDIFSGPGEIMDSAFTPEHSRENSDNSEKNSSVDSKNSDNSDEKNSAVFVGDNSQDSQNVIGSFLDLGNVEAAIYAFYKPYIISHPSVANSLLYNNILIVRGRAVFGRKEYYSLLLQNIVSKELRKLDYSYLQTFGFRLHRFDRNVYALYYRNVQLAFCPSTPFAFSQLEKSENQFLN